MLTCSVWSAVDLQRLVCCWIAYACLHSVVVQLQHSSPLNSRCGVLLRMMASCHALSQRFSWCKPACGNHLGRCFCSTLAGKQRGDGFGLVQPGVWNALSPVPMHLLMMAF